MITVKEFELVKPTAENGFSETKLSLPFGFQAVAFTSLKSEGAIEASILCDDEQQVHEETFRVTTSGIDLKLIFGLDPWAYRGCVVDQGTGERFHIWALPSTFERVETAKREAMKQAMLARAGGLTGGPGGGGLIVPGR